MTSCNPCQNKCSRNTLSGLYNPKNDCLKPGHSDESSEECVPQVNECSRRKKCFKDDKEVRSIKSFSIDTCLLQYRPRLITVPSKKYPTLDDALDILREFHGGYVIRLKPGIHCIGKNICKSVDYLQLIGDCCPFAGYAYINGCAPTFGLNTNPCCGPDCSLLGQGPFIITVSGRKITVTGSVNPNFSALCPGRKICMVRCDGVILEQEIQCASCNTITLKGDTGFTQNCTNPVSNIVNPTSGSFISLGEGFFICPQVVLTGTLDRVYINPTQRLIIRGVALNPNTLFTFGTHGGYTDISNCIIGNIFLFGNYDFTCPNTVIAHLTLQPDSIGRAQFQAFLGVDARLIGIGTAGGRWASCTFADNRNSIRLEAGACIHVPSSQFVNNCAAVVSYAHSFVGISGCFFCSNKNVFLAFIQSGVGAHPQEFETPEESTPIIRDSSLVFNVGFEGFYAAQNTILENNKIHYIIDSGVRVSYESNNIDSIGNRGSFVVTTDIPTMPETASDVGCAPSSATSPIAGTISIDGTSLHGVVGVSSIGNIPRNTVPLTT